MFLHVRVNCAGNMWAQGWNNIAKYVLPYPGRESIDVSPKLKEKVCVSLQCLHTYKFLTANNYFKTSLDAITFTSVLKIYILQWYCLFEQRLFNLHFYRVALTLIKEYDRRTEERLHFITPYLPKTSSIAH